MNLIAEQVKSCQKCDLCQTRINAVPGKVNVNAKIILVGEAPGRNEDKKGEPFVGSAGKRLDEILLDSGIDKNDVYRIHAVLFGEEIDIKKHEFKIEVKSPTFHEMCIEQGNQITLRYLLDL